MKTYNIVNGLVETQHEVRHFYPSLVQRETLERKSLGGGEGRSKVNTRGGRQEKRSVYGWREIVFGE